MTDLRKMFNSSVSSYWDDVTLSMEEMEDIRKTEWYKEAFLDAVKNKKFNFGLFAFIANADSPLYSCEKVFLIYKLYFGNSIEQEYAVEVLGCIENESFAEFDRYFDDIEIKDAYVKKQFDRLRAKSLS